MTQEEKFLLLKDLCSRLPHDTIVNVDNGKYREDMKLLPYHLAALNTWDIRPYLRPISSLTKEERIEIGKAIQKDRINPSGEIKAEGSDNLLLCTVRQSANLMEWLNAHHFDYHGLIDMGLALEAPEGMYDTKTE